MQLPQIQMVGLQELQRLFDHLQRSIACAFLRFAGEKRLASARLHHLAQILLAPALRAAIDRGRIQ